MTEFEAAKLDHGKTDGLVSGLEMLRRGTDPEQLRQYAPADAPTSPAEGKPGEWHYTEGFVLGIRQAAEAMQKQQPTTAQKIVLDGA